MISLIKRVLIMPFLILIAIGALIEMGISTFVEKFSNRDK